MRRCRRRMFSFSFLFFLFGGWFYTLTVANHDDCRRLKFLEPRDGFALIGHVIKNISLPVGIRRYSQCRNWCTMEDRCASINMVPREKDEIICQLSYSDQLQHPNDLKPTAGLIYRGTKNKCYFNKCYNNATCLVGFSDKGYKCICPPGYTGEHCEDVDECQNGIHECIKDVATCVNQLGSYYCICNHGYTGDGKTSCIPEECRRYTKLTDKTRKTTYVTRRKRCDKHLGPGWFRFQGRAGTKMPTKCLSMSRCGTYGTGWLRGTHPSVAEGAVDRTVCFRYRSCCKFSVIIRVRNCGSYYVYHLINTPACTLGYCGTG